MPYSLFQRLARWAFAPRRRIDRMTLTVAATVGAVLLAGCGSPSPANATDASGYHGAMLPAPVEKPAVVLTRADGTPYDLRAETDGYLTLLFFGYTNCPDVCPVHMASIAAVMAHMSFDETRRMKVIFVTIDPERDTPEKLGPWLAQFDQRFIALTGDSATLHDVQAEIGVTPAVKDTIATGASGYAMAHAAQVYAFTSDNLAHLVYPFGTRQKDWADDLPRLLDERWGADSTVAVNADMTGGAPTTASAGVAADSAPAAGARVAR